MTDQSNRPYPPHPGDPDWVGTLKTSEYRELYPDEACGSYKTSAAEAQREPSAREKVLAIYPDAYCAPPADLPKYQCYRIYCAKYKWSAEIGRSYDSEDAAWTNALSRLSPILPTDPSKPVTMAEVQIHLAETCEPVGEGDGAKEAVSQDEAMDEQVMRERDDYEDRLTDLANAVGSYFHVPVGEWSNCNEPDRVALGILNGEYKTKFDALSPPAEPVELLELTPTDNGTLYFEWTIGGREVLLELGRTTINGHINNPDGTHVLMYNHRDILRELGGIVAPPEETVGLQSFHQVPRYDWNTGHKKPDGEHVMYSEYKRLLDFAESLLQSQRTEKGSK